METKESSEDDQILINIGIVFLQLVTMALQMTQVFGSYRNESKEIKSIIITIVYIFIWIMIILFLRKHNCKLSLKLLAVIFGLSIVISFVGIIIIFIPNVDLFFFMPLIFLFGIQFSGIWFVLPNVIAIILILIISGCLFFFSVQKLIKNRVLE